MSRIAHREASVSLTPVAYLVIPIAAEDEDEDDDRPPRPDLGQLSRRNLCCLLHRYRRWRDELEAGLADNPWPDDEVPGGELRDFIVADILALNRELIRRNATSPPRPLADPSKPVSLRTLFEAAREGA